MRKIKNVNEITEEEVIALLREKRAAFSTATILHELDLIEWLGDKYYVAPRHSDPIYRRVKRILEKHAEAGSVRKLGYNPVLYRIKDPQHK